MSVLFEFAYVDFRSHRKTKYAKSCIFSTIGILLILQFARPNKTWAKKDGKIYLGDLGISTYGR